MFYKEVLIRIADKSSELELKDYVSEKISQHDYLDLDKKQYPENGEAANYLKVKIFLYTPSTPEMFEYDSLVEQSLPNNRYVNKKTKFYSKLEFEVKEPSNVIKLYGNDMYPPMFMDHNEERKIDDNFSPNQYAIQTIQKHINELYACAEKEDDGLTWIEIKTEANKLDTIMGKFILREYKDIAHQNGMTEEAYFRQEFSKAIKDSQKNLQHHSSPVGVVLKNLALCFTVVGAFFVIGKLIHSACTTGKPQGFFANQAQSTLDNLSDEFKPDETFNNSTYLMKNK